MLMAGFVIVAILLPQQKWINLYEHCSRAASNQREGFRRSVEGLLLPSQRHKTLTGLTNTEPVVGAQLARAQRLQWFLWESDWVEQSRHPGQTCPGVVEVTGEKRQSHPEALAVSLLCVLLLLVSCFSPRGSRLRRGSRTICARGSPPEQCSCRWSRNVRFRDS
jgi:hypothetical protein